MYVAMNEVHVCWPMPEAIVRGISFIFISGPYCIGDVKGIHGIVYERQSHTQPLYCMWLAKGV